MLASVFTFVFLWVHLATHCHALQAHVVPTVARTPYRIVCRMSTQNASWAPCSLYADKPARRLFRERLDTFVEPAPSLLGQKELALLPQDCLDAEAFGEWSISKGGLLNTSLGSNSRYAGEKFYLGPPSSLLNESEDVQARPHALQYRGKLHRDRGRTIPEFVWSPAADKKPPSCPQFEWLAQPEVETCLTDRWIAFWGDSTMRIAFSALVDFLGDGIEVSTFPTHDITYSKHWGAFDHCSDKNHCHLGVQFPKRRIVLTFNFVTKIEAWPNLDETLKNYADPAFKLGLSSGRRPDAIFMNSGPWEYYRYSGGWAGDGNYRTLLEGFLTDHFSPSRGFSNLIVFQNTACPQAVGNCEASTVSCMDAMDNINKLQHDVLGKFKETHGESVGIRLVGGQYIKQLPQGYTCAGETGYHLPSVITDLRVNHGLHAICRR